MRYRGNHYGVRLMGTWPHISLGISAHLWPPRFAHVSLHLPVGVAIFGCTGAAPLTPGEACALREQYRQKYPEAPEVL